MRGVLRYTLVWGARYTLGARYLLKNTVIILINACFVMTATDIKCTLTLVLKKPYKCMSCKINNVCSENYAA